MATAPTVKPTRQVRRHSINGLRFVRPGPEKSAHMQNNSRMHGCLSERPGIDKSQIIHCTIPVAGWNSNGDISTDLNGCQFLTPQQSLHPRPRDRAWISKSRCGFHSTAGQTCEDGMRGPKVEHASPSIHGNSFPSRRCTSQGVAGSVGAHASILPATHPNLHTPQNVICTTCSSGCQHPEVNMRPHAASTCQMWRPHAHALIRL